MAERKFLDLLGLQKYDEKIKAHLAAADAEVLAASKKYFEDMQIVLMLLVLQLLRFRSWQKVPSLLTPKLLLS